MIAVKTGGGGEPQAYNDENGEYVSVEVTIGGKKFSTYKDFREFLNGSPKFQDRLKKNKNEAEQAALSLYSQRFNEEVNRMNETSVVRFDNANDFEENMGRLFTQQRVNKLKEIMSPESPRRLVEPSPYRKEEYGSPCLIPSATIGVFNMVFGTPFMKPMSEDEFIQEYNSESVAKDMIGIEFGKNYWNNGPDMINMLKNVPSGKSIPFFRGMFGIEDRDAVFKGLYDKKSGVLSNIAYVSGGGSGIYTSVSVSVFNTEIDGGYVEQGGRNKGMAIHGLIDDVSNLRVAISTTRGGWRQNKDSVEIEELQNKARDKRFVGKLSEALKNANFGDNEQCSLAATEICSQISTDCGLAAAVLGYDALVGFGMEMVVLNPNVCRLSKTWHGNDRGI